jgi:hypothetical protein
MIELVLLAAAIEQGPESRPESRPENRDAVAGYECRSGGLGRWVGSGEIELAYGRRSVAIVNAALAGDDALLAQMVRPDATFSYFQGDMGLGQGTTGAGAARRFFRGMRPTAFQFLSHSWSSLAGDPCDMANADLLLAGPPPSGSFMLRFTYSEGRLVGVDGREATVVAGPLAPLRRSRRRR